MNPFQISKDTNINRLIDGIVILIIGMVIGIVAAQFVAFYESETITTTKVIQRVPLKSQDVKQGTVEAPKDAVKFNEI